MPDQGKKSGSLPTERATKEQTVVLVQSLLVDWKVLDHLKSKGLLTREAILKAREPQADGCCRPDGGTCCVNRKQN